MSLRDRFKSASSRADQPDRPDAEQTAAMGAGNGNGATGASAEHGHDATPDRTQGLKARIHRRMVERLNLANLDAVDPAVLRIQIGQIIGSLVAEENIPLSEAQRIRLEQEVMNETFGLGPIEPLLHDPDVSDILVNTYNQVYIERFGQLEKTERAFRRRRAPDEDHRPHRVEGRPPC